MSKLIITPELVAKAYELINMDSGIEHGFFATIEKKGGSYIVKSLVVPQQGDWQVQGQDQLQPTTAYAMRAVDVADTSGCGLLFVHTHPAPNHPPRLSPIDTFSLSKLGEVMVDMLSNDFLVGVIGVKGWYVAKFCETGFETIDTVAEVSEGYRLLNYVESSAEQGEIDDRQLRTLGSVNHALQSLTVAVVGSGGLGSVVAEQLVRIGVKKLILIDHDSIDTASNLRRIYGTKAIDFTPESPKFKVGVVGKYLRSLGLEVDVNTIAGSIMDSSTLEQVLDADIVISATDTHSSRVALCALPYEYGIPIIDIGVRVAKDNIGPAGFFAAVRVFTSSSSCFVCRGIVSPERIRIENLGEEALKAEQKEGYIPGEFGQPEPSIISLTTVAAGMGVSALINLLLDLEDRYQGLTFELLEGYTIHQQPTPKKTGCTYCG